MNDPNKAISVNLSSLLSLKAELLRKQAEVSKAKISQASATEFAVNKSASSQSATTKTKKHKKGKAKLEQDLDEKEAPKVVELEDSELLQKSQRVLAAKSKFYEKMSRSGGKMNSDDNCLVMFNRKKQEESSSQPYGGIGQYVESDSSDEDDDDDEDADDGKHNAKKDEDSSPYRRHDSDSDDDDDWVEYTDCLGRTRKCLRQDLESVKKRDKELADSMPERLDQTKPNWLIDTKGSNNNKDNDDDDDDLPIGPLPSESVFGDSTMSKLEEQKVNWERQEKENLDKSEVHYQDVFFDEARQHGVGYYAFSTDEDERQKQQRELEKRREQTVAEQKHREELRMQREKIIAERVRAAKNRQRARQGLPPLAEGEDVAKPATDDKEADQTERSTSETKEERKARKREEKLKKKQERDEAQREQERQQHIRPWDKEKGGVPANTASASEKDEEWSYKPEREPMSQEQWNEYKRTERNKEFAPVPEAKPQQKIKRTNFTSVPPPPTFYEMAPPPIPPPTQTGYGNKGFTSFQSTKRENRNFQRRNYEELPQQEPTHDEDILHRSRGAAIPPPSNLDADFTLPPHAKKTKSASELERSIEAGLRFLRNNCDKETRSTKSSWTAKADY